MSVLEKKEWARIIDLIFCLKNLEQEKQTKPKANRKKVIKKIRMEIRIVEEKGTMLWFSH